MTEKKIGVLGVGLMGGPIAQNLKKSGYSVMVYDKNQKALDELSKNGLSVAGSAKTLMEYADILFDVLNDTHALEDVMNQKNGLLAGINGSKVIIDMTTSDPEESIRIAKSLKERKVEYLDCPMTGGRIGAKNRDLILMAGGPKEVFESCRPILDKVSKTVIYLGPSGSGHYMKLIHNQLSHATFLAACEAYELGKQLGLDGEAMMDVFNAGNARSYATEVRFPQFILSGTFNAGATFDTVAKDIGLVMKKANDLNFDLPITRAAFNYWRYAVETGSRDEDYSKIVTLMEARYRDINHIQR